jgi:hypothetical protein
MTTIRVRTTLIAFGLASLLMGCRDEGRTEGSPTQLPAAPAVIGGTLSGIVFQVTAAGNQPVEGVDVYCDSCGPSGHSSSVTSIEGHYSFPGTPGGRNMLLLSKSGYNLRRPDSTTFDGWMGGIIATVNGDTRFDIELVKQ